MKMKRVTLGFSILALSAVAVLSCKPKPNVAPEPDTEIESARYVSYSNYVVSDIDMICSFLGEDIFLDHFYSEYPGSSSGNSGTVTCIRDTHTTANDHERRLSMSFNKTRCVDGRLRDGSVILDYGKDPAYPNAAYTRAYKFAGAIKFASYKVDGWQIELYDPIAPMYLYNTLSTPTYNPKSTNLTWRIAGKLKFTHPTDPNKNMIWEGELFKTLVNTSTPTVVPTPTSAINWSLAVINYTGHVSGTGPQIDENGVVTPNVPFTYTINPEFPLTRNFQCTPNKISGVVLPTGTGTITTNINDHHPFVSGVASFTTGAKYPRQIYYGNEGERDVLTTAQCDNTGEVLIKGISYRVDFME
jgi:hypothetical protein